MAIDDNSWEAGYECGIKDQKKASEAELAESRAQIDILTFANSQQFWEIAGLNQQIGVLQALLASRCKVSPDPTEPCQSQALSGTPGQT